MTPNKKLDSLDHLRTLAITLVLLFHYGQLFPHPSWAGRISKFGWTGVDLFFVLSGYLIASQLFLKIKEGQRLSLREFFIKRSFRIIPVYFVVLAIYFFIPYAREWESLAPAWKYLTFTQNIDSDLRTERTFSHVWSLCIEEQFYLLFPLILATLIYFRKISKGFIILLILFIAGFVIRYFIYCRHVQPYPGSYKAWLNWYEQIYYPTYCRLDGLLVGVSIAALFTFRPLLKEKIFKYGNMLLLLSIGILTGAYFVCLRMNSIEATVVGFPLVSIGYGCMVMGAVSPKSFLFKLHWKWSTMIATLSYGIYLSHKIVIHITQDQLHKAGMRVDGTVIFVACVVMCVVGAWVLNIVVEKPFLKWRARILDGEG